jgi:hypothetical protein
MEGRDLVGTDVCNPILLNHSHLADCSCRGLDSAIEVDV